MIKTQKDMQENIAKMKRIIETSSPIEKQRLFSIMAYNYGFSETTCKRYLDILENMGFIEVIDGIIKLNKIEEENDKKN